MTTHPDPTDEPTGETSGEAHREGTIDATFELVWKIHEPMLGYMSRLDDFAAQATGAATFDFDEGAVIPLAVRDGALHGQGSVELTAHGGAMNVPLVDVVIDGDELSITDPVDGAPNRLTLVTLSPAIGDASAPQTRTTALAQDADWMFNYAYMPYLEFAPLHIRERSRP